MKNNADPKPKTADWSAVEVSMVAGAKKTETRSVAVGTVLADIQSGKWREEVNAVAAGYAKAYEATRRGGKLTRWPRPRRPVRKDKEKLPGILFSGSFSRRASDALEMHSGILCVDMDNCSAPSELRAKLTNDPHVLAAFVSPTGSGVKALVRVKADASVHADNFAAARKHFGKTFGVSVDEACKDVSRLCFASYDPDAFIREEDAEILEPLPEAEQQQPPPKPEPEAETYESLPRPCYRVYHDCWRKGDKWMPPGTWFHDRTVASVDQKTGKGKDRR